MANSRTPGPLHPPSGMYRIPARTNGPSGLLDQGDPNVTTLRGDTPGPLGFNDSNDPTTGPLGSALARVKFISKATAAALKKKAVVDTLPTAAKPSSSAWARTEPSRGPGWNATASDRVMKNLLADSERFADNKAAPGMWDRITEKGKAVWDSTGETVDDVGRALRGALTIDSPEEAREKAAQIESRRYQNQLAADWRAHGWSDNGLVCLQSGPTASAIQTAAVNPAYYDSFDQRIARSTNEGLQLYAGGALIDAIAIPVLTAGGKLALRFLSTETKLSYVGRQELRASESITAVKGSASRSGDTMVKGAASEPAPGTRTSNASAARDSVPSASQPRLAEPEQRVVVAGANSKASVSGAVAGPNRAVPSFATSVEGPFSLLNRESRPVSFSQFVQHVEDSGLTGAFTKPLADVYSEVYAVEKFMRPDPTTYLAGDFVTAHTQRFITGAARVDSTASFNARYLRDIEAGLPFGRPDAVFASPATLIDELYATGSPSIMESTLGFDAGTFSGAGSMTRTYIDNPTNVGLRFATGREGGANDYWVPGGYTIKTTGGAGLPEMVTNQLPSPSVSPNIRILP